MYQFLKTELLKLDSYFICLEIRRTMELLQKNPPVSSEYDSDYFGFLIPIPRIYSTVPNSKFYFTLQIKFPSFHKILLQLRKSTKL